MADITLYEPLLDEEVDADHESLGKPFRVIAKLKNGRLIRAREALGDMSCLQAAKRIGVTYGDLCAYEGLRASPWNERKGTWRKQAQKIAAAYAYSPEELWPEVIKRVKERVATLEIAAPEVTLLDEEGVDLERLKSVVKGALSLLPSRQRLVLEERFGIGTEGGEGKTLDEVAPELDVGRERVRQIEAEAMMALRKDKYLRHLHTPKENRFTCPGCGRVVDHPEAHKPRKRWEGRNRLIWACDRTRKRPSTE